MVFGFVNYDGDLAVREAFADGIRPHFEEFTEELEAGMRVDSLTADDLVDLGYRGEDEETGIDVLGVTTRVAMRSTVDEIAEVITGDMSLVVDTTEVYETTPMAIGSASSTMNATRSPCQVVASPTASCPKPPKTSCWTFAG